jgi:glutaredoxin
MELIVDNKFYPQEEDEWTIYSTSWCGPCKRIKAYFDKHNIPYKLHDLGSPTEAKAKVSKLVHLTNNKRTIPIIFHYSKCIGGCSETLKYLSEMEKQKES